MSKPSLQPEVAEKYKLVGIEPGTHCFNGLGTIDLCAMDIALADQLFASGNLPVLVLKVPVPKKKP